MNLLIIGPFPNPVTGESLANQVIDSNIPNNSKYRSITINTAYDTFSGLAGKFSIRKVFYYSRLYWFLNKVFLADKVYITIGQSFFGIIKYYPFILLSHLLKKEIIIHVHGNGIRILYDNSGKWKKKIINLVIGKAKKGIVLSYLLKRNLTPFILEENIFTVNNFVEDYLLDGPQIKSFNSIKIVYLSNLMRAKGVLELLEALVKLKKSGVKFEARFAGNIDSDIKDSVYKNFELLSDSIQYLGVVSGEDKKEILDWGNTFILPSYTEGQPISILEAMSRGNVIISTNVGGIRDVVKEKINGFFIDGTSDSISEKITSIFKNQELLGEISSNNIKEAKIKYKIETFLSNLIRVFDK